MPKPSAKLDPATEAVVRRMLATPPQSKKPVKKKALKGLRKRPSKQQDSLGAPVI
jgi:hypothetical protein